MFVCVHIRVCVCESVCVCVRERVRVCEWVRVCVRALAHLSMFLQMSAPVPARRVTHFSQLA